MSSSEKRNLTETLRFRLSPEEKEHITEQAGEACLSVSAYIRKKLFPEWKIPSGSTRPKPEYVLYSEAMRGLGRVGGNVNQIAKVLNRGGSVERKEVEATMKELRELKSALMKALRLEELDE